MSHIDGYKLIGFWDTFGLFGDSDFFGTPVFEKDDKLYFADYNEKTIPWYAVEPTLKEKTFKEKILNFVELVLEEEEKLNIKTFDSVKCISLIGEYKNKDFVIGDDYLFSFALIDGTVILANIKGLYNFFIKKGYELVAERNHDKLDHFIDKVEKSNLWPMDKNVTRKLKLDVPSGK